MTNYGLFGEVAVDVEGGGYFVVRDGNVGKGFADGAQEGETGRGAGTVFLVRGYGREKLWIVVAGESERGKGGFQEIGVTVYLLARKAEAGMAEDDGGEHAVGYGYSVRHGTSGAESQHFEGVSGGVAEVENLAQSFLVRVAVGNAFLCF